MNFYDREGLNAGSLPALTHDREAHCDGDNLTYEVEADNTANPVVTASDNAISEYAGIFCLFLCC